MKLSVIRFLVSLTRGLLDQIRTEPREISPLPRQNDRY